MTQLIQPQGVSLLLSSEEAKKVKERAIHLPSLTLNLRQTCDLELLLNGAFSPLAGFMDKRTYEHVLKDMRLPSQLLWPIPITLDVSEEKIKIFKTGDAIALRDREGVLLATLTISDIWKPHKNEEAQLVFKTTSLEHPGVAYLMNEAGDTYIGGQVCGVELPPHYDFVDLRKTPENLRKYFEKEGHTKVVAFQTRNPIHRAHFELTLEASKKVGAHLLLHPVVGMTKPGDIDYYTRVRCYQKLLPWYPPGSVTLSLLNLAMRMGGPREALWHALIRKNFGCTHFIVGRDHAGPGKDSQGKEFYGPYEAQTLLTECSKEIGMEIIPFKELVYVNEEKKYYPVDQIPQGRKPLNISGTDLRDRLKKGLQIPEWFSFPSVIEELRTSYPPRSQQGFTVFFTGLSGSGKSTVANALRVKLMEWGKKVTILDGDIVRTFLSSELGFSKEHRSLNIRRIGFVASEITKNGGVAICCPIAPYEADRQLNRELIFKEGGYIEVFMCTPLNVCETRDRKGLYEKARKGLVTGFTGINDPYEEPNNPEIKIDTSQLNIAECVDKIVDYLMQEGFLERNHQQLIG